MKTFLTLLVVATAVTGFAQAAEAKPKIAVLGLEVVDNGKVEKDATQAAQLLTEELRAQVGKRGNYTLAPNSAKDLLEMKLLSDCSDEGRGCMAAIGADLGADLLLYGKLERRKSGYEVTLLLLDVQSKQLERISEVVPADDLRSGKIGKWSAAVYGRLVGVEETGSLEIDANVERATVYVDDKVATTLSDGAARVVGLAEGPHTVTIEADGYEEYEAKVAITAGETEALSVSLAPLAENEPDEPTGDKGSVWKVAFIGGAVATAGLLGGWTYNGVRVVTSLESDKNSAFAALPDDAAAYTAITGNAQGTIEDSCGKAKSYATSQDQVSGSLRKFVDACEAGESAAMTTNVFMVGTFLAAAATAYFGYQAWFAEDARETRSARSKKRSKNRVIVTPTIDRDRWGAGVRIDF